MLNIEVDVDKKIPELLRQAKEAGVNLTIPFTLIAKSWFKANRSIFTQPGPGRYPDLGGFNPNAPAWKGAKITRRTYAKFRKLKEHGFVYPLMRASGALESSITDPTDSNSINLIINQNTLYLGTRVEYAPYHQSPAPRSKIPFRPIVFIGVEQLATTEQRNEYTRWINILEDSIQQKLDQAAGKP